MEAVHGSMLLVYAVIAIALLILLITRYKVYPFLVLIIVSLLLGLASGMPIGTIVKSFETGNGNTLGHIAIVVGLGTMLGKMMAESGGAERIATTLIDRFGEKHIHWAMMVVAIIVGLPVFFEVGFVLLIPIAFNVAKRTSKSLLLIGLPMVAGLSVVHGLIPPHPAAMLAVQAYHADIGKTIAYGLIVGVPTAIVAGPLFALLISRYIKLPKNNPLAAQFLGSAARRTAKRWTRSERRTETRTAELRHYAVHHFAAGDSDAGRQLGRPRVHAEDLAEQSAALRRQFGCRAADRRARQFLDVRRERAVSIVSRSRNSAANVSRRSRVLR